ncbi:hypothetical protein BJX76DRAFT_262971 [Aspergillus varians]
MSVVEFGLTSDANRPDRVGGVGRAGIVGCCWNQGRAASLEGTVTHSPARRSPHLALISVSYRNCAAIIPLATNLPKITQMPRSALHSTNNQPRSHWEKQRTRSRDVETGAKAGKSSSKESRAREELGQQRKRTSGRTEITAASTPAMRAKRRQPGALPQSQPRHYSKPRVCRPEWVYASGPRSLLPSCVCQILAREPEGYYLSDQELRITGLSFPVPVSEL